MDAKRLYIILEEFEAAYGLEYQWVPLSYVRTYEPFILNAMQYREDLSEEDCLH
jgi:hypothetical protein